MTRRLDGLAEGQGVFRVLLAREPVGPALRTLGDLLVEGDAATRQASGERVEHKLGLLARLVLVDGA